MSGRMNTPICVCCGVDTDASPEGREVWHGFTFCNGCVASLGLSCSGGALVIGPNNLDHNQMSELFRILDL